MEFYGYQRAEGRPGIRNHVLILPTCACGSDATSGIASNPAVGNLSDRLVDLGASTMMSESIEWIGGEHVLARRGATPEIHDQIIKICEDYEKHLLAFMPKT